MKRIPRFTSSGPAAAPSPPPANLRGEPTMSDVAAAAGCARSTVSMALRGDPRIALETRKHIAGVAGRIGYRSNPLVAALMKTRRMQCPSARHLVLAYVTTHPGSDPWRNYPTHVRFFAGAQRYAERLGYKLEEFSLRAPGMTPARFGQILRARGIHGLLIAPLPHGEKAIACDVSGVAAVGVGLSVWEPRIERVSSDHFQSALLAVRRCLDLGYRRIGLAVCRETSVRLDDRWLSGFLLGVHQAPGLAPLPPLMPEREEEIGRDLPAWCRRERPDVVIFGNFDPSLPHRLPQGTDTVLLDVERTDGPWTGIFQDAPRLGALAVEHLVARLERNELGPLDRGQLHLLAGEWAPGRSALGPGRSA